MRFFEKKILCMERVIYNNYLGMENNCPKKARK